MNDPLKFYHQNLHYPPVLCRQNNIDCRSSDSVLQRFTISREKFAGLNVSVLKSTAKVFCESFAIAK